MRHPHLDAILLVDMLRQVLRTIDAAVLSARASEAEHQGSEAPLHISLHMMVGQLIDRFEEVEDLAVVLQKSDHRLVQSRQFLVRLIASRVVRASAVEDIASAVARLVLGNAVLVGEAIYTDHQRALAIVFREGGGTIQRVGLEDVVRRGAEAIGPVLRWFLDARKLWQFHQALQDRHQVGVGEGATVEGEQVAQVLDSPRYGVDEVALMLEVPPETIRSQHL